MDVKVRVGTIDDLEEVMSLARLMHGEIGFFGYNPDKVLPDIYAALKQDRGVMGLIGGIGDEPLQGGILLRVCKAFYSDDDILEDRGLFVRPEHRSSARKVEGGGRRPHAIMLCNFAKQAAETLGLKLFIGLHNNVNTEGKIRLYERQFGTPCGAFFLYDPAAQASKSEAA